MALGGYRPRSGRSKSGYYKGIYCGSTYELCWAIHALDHNIPFTRFPGQLQKDKLIYIPDFLLADGKTIIEPKGYERDDSVAKKTALAESLGYKVKIMKKEDLKYAFDYVYQTYGTKNYQILYDDYKPKYTYTCSFCGNEFKTDKKSKLILHFCGRVCSGKFRQKNNTKNGTQLKPNKGQFGHPDNEHNEIKLTKEEALYIYYEENKSHNELAKEFNLKKTMIHFIKNKKTYKWIHDENSNNFKPKTYNSLQDYHKEKKNERLNMIKEILAKFKEQKIIFSTQVELAFNVVKEASTKYSIEISPTTFRKKEYLQKQSSKTTSLYFYTSMFCRKKSCFSKMGCSNSNYIKLFSIFLGIQKYDSSSFSKFFSIFR